MKSLYKIIEEGIKEYEFEEWCRIEAASIEEMEEYNKEKEEIKWKKESKN